MAATLSDGRGEVAVVIRPVVSSMPSGTTLRVELLAELCGMVERWKAAGRPQASVETRFNKKGWGRIVGGVEYATALFEHATVERYVVYLRRALEAMIADDRQHVDRLELRPAADLYVARTLSESRVAA